MKKNSKIYIWKLYRLKEKEKNEKYREDVKKMVVPVPVPLWIYYKSLIFSSSRGFRTNWPKFFKIMKEYDKTDVWNFKVWQKNLIIDLQCLKLKIWRHITTINAIEQQYHFKTLDKYHKKKL